MWAVRITYEENLPEADLIALSDSLDATVAAEPGVAGFSVTVHQPEKDLTAAAQAAVAHLAHRLHAPPIGIEVLTAAEYERRAMAPNAPDIVSAVEAAEILGVSRQRLHQLRARPQFPSPLYELRTGPLWTREAIHWFAQTWDRKAGRPALRSA